MKQSDHQRVDHNALRTNQGSIIAVLSAGFILDQPLFVFICGALMLVGSLFGRPAYLPVYRLLRSVQLLQPDLIADHNEPHRFAQTVGAVVLLVGSLAFMLHAPALGWILTWVVILLAGLNLFLGFCLGCTLYFWLARLGVPGFDKMPVERRS